ncbi:MAG: hypothetical protein P8X73_02115 [Ignavibacteriaceae bacterium]
MEPKVLMIGRSQNVIDILIGGLKNMGHDIIGTDNQESVYNLVKNHKIELVCNPKKMIEFVDQKIVEFKLSKK